MKFKVGDKVKVVKTVNKYKKCYIGKELVINSINPNIYKTTGEHYGVNNCMFVFFDEELELINKKKIVITSDGKETLARLYDGYEVIKSAIAKCSPEDTFDFETGARIAFDRLVGTEPIEEKPKYYNGKVVCVDNRYNESAYTVGKIYQFKDGEFMNDIGEMAKIYGVKKCKTFGEWQRFTNSKFIEVVE